LKQVVVLGSGMMGSAIAGDLSKEYSIKIVDINETNLKKATDKYIAKTDYLGDYRADLITIDINKNKAELRHYKSIELED